MTEPAKKAPAKRTNRRAPAAPKAVEAKANEALSEMGWPAPTPEQWDEAQRHVMSRPYPNVHELWSRVMESVRSVAKGDYNKDQRFHFRGVDAVVDNVGPALRAHKIHVRPRRILDTSATEYTSKGGSRMVNRVVHVEWEVTGPQGDSFVGESMGEAADSSDKSMSKAQSVAYRVFLLQSLCIPTGDDPDFETHERATSSEAQQYSRQRPSQPQQSASQDERRQAQAGEENQAAQADIEEARRVMWQTLKAVGWEWKALAARFASDHDGRETSQASKAELEAFTSELIREAELEEDRAKQVVQDELGGKPIEDAKTGGLL